MGYRFSAFTINYSMVIFPRIIAYNRKTGSFQIEDYNNIFRYKLVLNVNDSYNDTK